MARESYYHVGPKVPELGVLLCKISRGRMSGECGVVRGCLGGGRCNDGGCSRASLPKYWREGGRKGVMRKGVKEESVVRKVLSLVKGKRRKIR